jgi:hypothetical protein
MSLWSIFFHSCTPTKVSEEEMIGIWKSSDESQLSLNGNRTFTLEGFAASHLKLEWQIEKLSFKANGTGEWKIENKHNQYVLELTFIEIMGKTDSIFDGEKYRIKKYGFPLAIVGSGFFANKPPWKLYSSTIWYDFPKDYYSIFEKAE